MIIEWVLELPPSLSNGGTRNPVYDEGIEQLKQFPGQWALIESGAPTGVTAASSGLRHRGAKIASRKQADGTYKLYASWPKQDEE